MRNRREIFFAHIIDWLAHRLTPNTLFYLPRALSPFRKLESEDGKNTGVYAAQYLVSVVREQGADKATYDLMGITQGADDLGDWRVIVERKNQ